MNRASLALLLPLLAPGVHAGEPEVNPPDTLVADRMPPVPRRIALRMSQYLAARGATLSDWDPVGEGILVRTRFAETEQVHHVAGPGKDRRQLTFFDEPVAGAAFDPQVVDGFYFLRDEGGGEFHQIYWFDRRLGQATLLTDGKSRNQELRVAHGGGKFAFASTLRNGTDSDVYVHDGHAPGESRRVTELGGEWTPLDWSPDDKKLLVRRFVSINESTLHLLDLESGKMQPIHPRPGEKIAYGTALFTRRGNGIYATCDEGSEFKRLIHLDLDSGKSETLTPDLADVEGLDVSTDGKWIAYTLNEVGASALFLADTAAAGRAARIDTPAAVIGGLAFDRASRRLGFTMTSAAAPSDVHTLDLLARTLTRWTESEVGGLDRVRFAVPKSIEFTSFDGTRIGAWYYRPKGGGKGPFPVVIDIHGGPEGQARPGFNALVQFWVQELGLAVILPNVRGSSGRGKRFLDLDNGVKREDSVKDIGALLDWIATRPELDRARVGVSGGSYGGYMVLASLVHYSDRLRCGVDSVGIANFVTFLENTQSYRRDLRRVEYGDEREPAMRAFLEGIAPVKHAARIRVPLFVVQGQNDPRVPMTEAEQIVKAVRGEGREVWYLLGKDEGHGFKKKANRDFYLNAVALFLERYLLPEPATPTP
jgi:dipeptidyl aminopeptidase/acylaminoacyl peptidase